MKKKLILTALIITMLILPTTLVNANYQSIPTERAKSEKPETWIIGIRQMEATGQVMGLNETIDTDTAKSASGSNDIDVHMIKNTEYGAIVLLGASNYGKQGTGQNRYMDKGETTTTGTGVKASTTGNVSGVYEMGGYSSGHGELTAAGGQTFLSSKFPNLAPRYVDRYKIRDESSAKIGDATVETRTWHGNTTNNWLSYDSYGIERGSWSTFSYESYSASDDEYSRAIVVSGTGF